MNEFGYEWLASLACQILHNDNVTLMMDVCSVPLLLHRSGGPCPFTIIVSEELGDIIP